MLSVVTAAAFVLQGCTSASTVLVEAQSQTWGAVIAHTRVKAVEVQSLQEPHAQQGTGFCAYALPA